jgi:peptidoglycan/LPS O-acetylase OafA/YrhL
MQRLVALDGLRGVAALAVVLFHLRLFGRIEADFSQAYLAVDFFFVLSGFVIGRTYEPGLRAGSLPLLRYAQIRLARLWPCIALGVALGATAVILNSEPHHRFVWSIAMQMLCLPAFGAGLELSPLNGPQWSLFYELAANAVHATVARWLGNAALITIIVLSGASLISVAFDTPGLSVGVKFDTFLAGFARVGFSFSVGLALSRLHRSGRLMAPRLPYPVAVLALIVLLVLPAPGGALGVALHDLVVVMVLFPLLVALAVNSRVPTAVAGVAGFLGAISYPLYALHVPVYDMLEPLLWGELAVGSQWASWAVYLLGCLLLAWAVARFYERPVQKLLLKLGGSRSTSARAAVSVTPPP